MTYVSLLVYALDLDGRLHQRRVHPYLSLGHSTPMCIYRLLLFCCGMLSQRSHDITFPLFFYHMVSSSADEPFPHSLFPLFLFISLRTTLASRVIYELIVEHDVCSDVIIILVYNATVWLV